MKVTTVPGGRAADDGSIVKQCGASACQSPQRCIRIRVQYLFWYCAYKVWCVGVFNLNVSITVQYSLFCFRGVFVSRRPPQDPSFFRMLV